MCAENQENEIRNFEVNLGCKYKQMNILARFHTKRTIEFKKDPYINLINKFPKSLALLKT